MLDRKVQKEVDRGRLARLRTPASEPLFRRLLEKLPAGAYTCDADRLRMEHVGPGAGTLTRAQRGNHAATLLTDIAVTLLSLEDGAGSTTCAAGSEIQRVCAIEHGQQRGHLGWRESDITREYHALWEEIARSVRALGSRSEEEHERVPAAARNRIEQARSHSVRRLRSVADGR